MATPKVPAVSIISKRMSRLRELSSSMLMYSSVSLKYSPARHHLLSVVTKTWQISEATGHPLHTATMLDHRHTSTCAMGSLAITGMLLRGRTANTIVSNTSSCADIMEHIAKPM